MAADFVVTNHGSLYILDALHQDAFDHLRAGLDDEAQFWGPMGVVVEPRYIQPLVAQLSEEGWTIV